MIFFAAKAFGGWDKNKRIRRFFSINDVFLLIRMVLSIVFAVVAALDDLKRFKVSNRIIAPFFVAGALLTLVQAVMGEKVSEYIYGMSAGFLFMFVLYCFRGIGAADVKLAAVHGLLTGLCGIQVILVSAFIGGTVVGLVKIALKKCTVRHVAGIPFKTHAIHFGAAILFGVVIFAVKVIVEGGSIFGQNLCYL